MSSFSVDSTITVGCYAGMPSNAFSEIIRLGGVEGNWDYGKYDGVRKQCKFDKSKAKVYITGSVGVSTDEHDIADALMEHGPLSAALNAAWMQFYHGGISYPRNVFGESSY